MINRLWTKETDIRRPTNLNVVKIDQNSRPLCLHQISFFCVETITIIVAVSLLCSLQERKWFKRSTVFLSKAEKILMFDLRLCWLFWSRATFLSPELEFPANLLYVLYSVEVYPVHGRLPCNFNGINSSNISVCSHS